MSWFDVYHISFYGTRANHPKKMLDFIYTYYIYFYNLLLLLVANKVRIKRLYFEKRIHYTI